MECPYCRGEMEPGTLISNRRPVWVPKSERIGLMMSHRKIKESGGFNVGRPKMYYEAEAWYCQTCNRLTIFNAK